jgi:hypothetical protein
MCTYVLLHESELILWLHLRLLITVGSLHAFVSLNIFRFLPLINQAKSIFPTLDNFDVKKTQFFSSDPIIDRLATLMVNYMCHFYNNLIKSRV